MKAMKAEINEMSSSVGPIPLELAGDSEEGSSDCRIVAGDVVTGSPGLAVGFTIVLIVVSLFGTSAVRAEVHVQGNATAVEVDIEDHARIAEVLSALGQAFNVRYRTSIALDGVIGGTYAGSLGEVISRVLDGYNFFIMQNGNALAVVVLGKSNNRSVPLASTPNFTPKRDSTNRRRRD